MNTLSNTLNPFATNTKKKKPRKQVNNFLEAFKSIAHDTVRTVVSEPGKIMSRALGGGELRPNQSLEVGKVWETKDQKLQQERATAVQKKQEWQMLYRNEKEKVKMGLEVVRQEIQKLIQSLGKLGKEIDKATFQAPADPGIYHENFFEKLRQTLQDMRLRADSSASWMQMCNRRSGKKQGVFWAKFKKHGTKYGLSSERGAAFSGA